MARGRHPSERSRALPHDSPAGGAPRLTTARLTLRPHRLDDFDAAVAMWADPHVTRYIGGKPSTRQQTWVRMLGYAGHWELLRFGYWAIEETSSGAFIGELGFADFKREIDATMRDPELGWALVSPAHGKGYASEAVAAAVSWGDRWFERARTVCMIDPRNLASLRVAAKCGYREFARRAFSDRPMIFLERLRAGVETRP